MGVHNAINMQKVGKHEQLSDLNLFYLDSTKGMTSPAENG